MRLQEPFLADDLADLDERLLGVADAVVPMCSIAAGEDSPRVIGLRHDVDNVFEPALEIARWEAERGYQSTFFILHDSPYWDDPGLQAGLEEIAELGHEIGIHSNALSVALQTGRDPWLVLGDAIGRLRAWGHPTEGVVAHGDPLCYRARFVNDEMFVECARPDWGASDRELRYRDVTVKLEPRPLSDMGLKYDAYRAGSRSLYLSDSGGRWSTSFDGVCERFGEGQLHILWHPDWWAQAFPARVASLTNTAER